MATTIQELELEAQKLNVPVYVLLDELVKTELAKLN